jgi:ABC-2 type transport system permease protein
VSRLPFNITILTVDADRARRRAVARGDHGDLPEGGILKRLRATPLSPVTILGSHVLVKLSFTLATMVLMILAGRRVLPGAMPEHAVSFIAAVMLSTTSILSFGFVMASLVRSARFARRSGRR